MLTPEQSIYDVDGDGKLNAAELKAENEDKKLDAQRKMAWLAALSMPLYAILPIFPFISETRIDTLAAMSDMLFLSQASIVGLFFGTQAYMSKR